jgi:hypothetical protein
VEFAKALRKEVCDDPWTTIMTIANNRRKIVSFLVFWYFGIFVSPFVERTKFFDFNIDFGFNA